MQPDATNPVQRSGATLSKNVRRVTLMPDPLHCPSVFAHSRIEIRSDPSGAADRDGALGALSAVHEHVAADAFVKRVTIRRP